MAIDPNIDTSLSGAPPTRPLSGLEMGLLGGAFSGTTAQPSGGLSGTGKGGGMQGGPSLAELQLLMALGGGGDTGNLSSLLAPIGAGSFSQGAGFGQSMGGQNTVAGQSMTTPTGQVAGGGGSNTVDPFSLIAKIAGAVGKGVGLASPTSDAAGLSQSDISGSDPAAFAAQRAGERDTTTSAASPFNMAGAFPFNIPSGVLTGVSGGSVAPASGDWTQMSPQSVSELLKQQENMDLVGAGSGGAQNLPLGSSTTASSLSGAPTSGGIPGSANVVPSTNFGGALQGGIGGGLGIANILQAIQNGNLGQGLSGGVQGFQGLAQLLQNSPELAQSLNIPESVLGSFKDIFGPGGSLSGGVGNIAGGIGLLGSLTGNSDLSQIGSAIGGIPAAATIAGAIPALSGGLTSALSANPYTAAIAAAITQIMQMYGDISSGRSGENTFLNGLVAPIPIIGSTLTKQINKIFDPSEAWMQFPSEVSQTAGLEDRALKALIQGLPYVQSQDELANAIGAFKSTVGERVGGYGAGSGMYDIPGLSEVGTTTHGYATNPTNFAAITPQVQQAIQQLLPLLPATYTGTDTSNPLVRDFEQFYSRRGTGDYAGSAPLEYYTNDPASLAAYQQYPGQFPNQIYLPGSGPQGVLYGDPAYDYAAAGFPGPGQTFGTISPYWSQLTGAPMAGPYTPPVPPAPTPFAQIPPPAPSLMDIYAQTFGGDAWTSGGG
jgi:hypothetical protein